MRYALPLAALVFFALPAWAVEPAKDAATGGKAAAATKVPAKKAGVPDAGQAPDPAVDATDPLQVGRDLLGAVKSGQARESVALVIVLLMFVWRRTPFRKFVVGKVKSKYALALITAGVTYLASLGVALSVGDFSVGKFVVSGLLTSAEAIGFFHLGAKPLLEKVFGAVPKEEPKPSA